MTEQHAPASPRVTMKRGANRAVYSPAVIRSILEAGHLAHVGVSTERGPIVLPMAYGVRSSDGGGEDGDELLIHGSVANAMMRAGRDLDVCVTVTVTVTVTVVVGEGPRRQSDRRRGRHGRPVLGRCRPAHGDVG